MGIPGLGTTQTRKVNEEENSNFSLKLIVICSHSAILIGRKVYLFGGKNHSAAEDSEKFNDLYVIDLGNMQ